MKLWLLRHARVLAAPGLCYGASDLPADPEATRAAARAAAAVLPAGLPVWVSGLQRARQLADALRAERPDLGRPHSDVRLNEMDFGCWEGWAWADIPREALDAWTEDFAHHRFGGVESTQEVLDRVAAALADVLARVGASGEAAWVTHAGVVRAVMVLAERGLASLQHARDWPVEGVGPGGYRSIHVEWPLKAGSPATPR
jgi:alpha-ribazole phosphatase